MMSEVLTSSRNLESSRFGFGLFRQKYVWLAMTPFIVLLLFAVYHGVNQWQADQANQRQIDQWAKAGVPYDNASLQQAYLQRTFPEGHADWARAMELSEWGYAIDSFYQLPYLGGDAGIPPKLVPDANLDQWVDEELVASYLDEMQPVIDLVERASSHPTPVQFPMHFQGISTLLPHVQSCRSITRVLLLDCEYAYSQNETQRALRDLSLTQSTAEAFDSPDCLVSLLATAAVRGMKLRTIRRTLTHCAWDESQLAALRELMSAEKDIAAPWRQAITNERALVLATLDDVESTRIMSKLTGNDHEFSDDLIMPSDIQLLMEYYNDLIDASSDSILQWKKNVKEIERDLNANHQNSVVGMILPATAQTIASAINVEQTRRWTLVAVALRQYHLQQGKWPQQLSDLGTLGLVFDDYSNINGELFGYEVDGETAYLWKNKYKSDAESRISPTRPTGQEKDRLETFLLELHST